MKSRLHIRSTILLVLLFQFACQNREAVLKKDSIQLVKQIENYKEENLVLPSSLNDLGLDDKLEGPIFYEKQDSGYYILWFGTDLGESVTYSSRTGIWK